MFIVNDAITLHGNERRGKWTEKQPFLNTFSFTDISSRIPRKIKEIKPIRGLQRRTAEERKGVQQQKYRYLRPVEGGLGGRTMFLLCE